MHKYQIEQQEVYYTVQGEGKPLLFLHGFLEDHKMWELIYPHFVKEGYQCIMVDLPCHGKSRFYDTNCSMQFMAQVVDALLLELEIIEPTIIGHSMGGYVALELNALRTSNIILLHSNFWTDSKQKKIDRNRVVQVVENNKSLFIGEAIPGLFAPNNRDKCKAIIEQLIEGATQLSNEEIIAATVGMRDRNPNYNLAENTQLSIIQGEFDPIIPKTKMLKEIDKLNLDPNYIELAEISHMSIWEDTKSLIKVLKSQIMS